jgi:hypothetical protein
VSIRSTPRPNFNIDRDNPGEAEALGKSGVDWGEQCHCLAYVVAVAQQLSQITQSAQLKQ